MARRHRNTHTGPPVTLIIGKPPQKPRRRYPPSQGSGRVQRPIPVLSIALAGLLVGICLGITLHLNRSARIDYPPAATSEQISTSAP